MPHTVSNSPGTARLKVPVEPDRWVYVGPFASLESARRMAQDLPADSPAVIAVRLKTILSVPSASVIGI